MQNAVSNVNHSTSNSLAHLGHASQKQSFFQPVKVDKIAHLIERVARQKKDIKLACQFFKEGGETAFYHLLKASNATLMSQYGSIFDAERGMKYIYAQAWEEALKLIDVSDYMPNGKRKEWNTLIEENNTPEFDEAHVVPTLTELLNSRELYLSEVVADIFHGLSGDHVTNQSWGFSKRMIMPSLHGKGTAEPTQTAKALIGDLRAIIAKMHHRKVSGHKHTEAVIDACRFQMGKWMPVDGGALKIKVFKVGTVHVEVHPDVAWRLNQILAIQYPNAIPPESRQPEKRRAKVSPLRHDLISPGALTILSRPRPAKVNVGNDYIERYEPIDNAFGFDKTDAFGFDNEVSVKEAVAVCVYLGGTVIETDTHEHAVQFEPRVNVRVLLNDVVATGTLPEKTSHQFYPTPAWLVSKAQSWANIEESMRILEPSAGKGVLIENLDNVTCIEVSAIHCAVLKAKGHKVVEGDFEALHSTFIGQFDRILMNPPFSQGQAKRHLEYALACLKDKGVLVAIIPASLKGSFSQAGITFEYSDVIEGAFYDEGAAVNVILVKATKQ